LPIEALICALVSRSSSNKTGTLDPPPRSRHIVREGVGRF
jgi:hypothetical protein